MKGRFTTIPSILLLYSLGRGGGGGSAAAGAVVENLSSYSYLFLVLSSLTKTFPAFKKSSRIRGLGFDDHHPLFRGGEITCGRGWLLFVSG